MRRAILSIVSILTFVTGLVVITGWMFDIDVVKSLLPDAPTMKFSTALSFVFSAMILMGLTRLRKSPSSVSQLVIVTASYGLLFTMGLVVLSTMIGFEATIESVIVSDSIDAIVEASIGWPSIGTTTAFLLMGIAGLVAMSPGKRARLVVRLLASIITILGIIALLGYGVSIPSLYYAFPDEAAAMAIHTAFLFVLCGIGLLISSEKKTQ